MYPDTRSYAPPNSKDGFFYSGSSGFHVVVDRHRVDRESAGRIYELVNYTPPPPLLTKAGKVAKRQPAPHEDLPAHFYQGQLVHYGLKVFKTKDAAKKHLRTAFESSADKKTLMVPPNILEIEKELKKQWDEANVVAKKTHEDEKERRRLEEIEKLRMAQEERDATIKNFYKDTVVKPNSRDDAMALGSDDDFDDDDDEDEDEGEDEDEFDWRRAKRPAKKQKTLIMSKDQLNAEITKLTENDIRELLKTLLKRVPAVQGILDKEISKQKALKAAPNSSGKKSKLNWIGEYTVLSPDLCNQWSEVETADLTLKLLPSSTASHIWASFDFGIYSGIMRSSNISQPILIGSIIEFGWRGRDSGEGQMTFGKGNKGKLRFLGNGKIDATMTGGGASKFKFFGTLEANQVSAKKDQVHEVKDFKKEYRRMNSATHDAEATARWGKWGGEGKTESPAYSDTSEGGESDGGGSDEDEEDYYGAF